MPRRLPLATALVLAAVAVVLLVPAHLDRPVMALLQPVAHSGSPVWWAFEDGGNVLLFVPLGYLLARWTGPLPGFLLGTAISACCEAAQRLVSTRDPSLLDVAMNAAGALLGAVLAVVAARRVRRRIVVPAPANLAEAIAS